MACDSARIYEGVVVGPKRLGERHAFAVENQDVETRRPPQDVLRDDKVPLLAPPRGEVPLQVPLFRKRSRRQLHVQQDEVWSRKYALGIASLFQDALFQG